MKESAFFDHLLQCDCTTDFGHFDILASDSNSFRLLIKEGLLLKRGKLVLNGTVNSFPWKLFDYLYRTQSLHYIIRIIYLKIELYDWQLHYFGR